jgi:hypothetical protein
MSRTQSKAWVMGHATLAKHVMVVADSCFSGTITRAIKIEQRTPEWLSQMFKKKARTALT